MSSPALGSPINGHITADDANTSSIIVDRHRSASPASNGSRPPSRPTSPSNSIREPRDVANHLSDDDRMSESAGSSPGDASHDADFDMEESAPSPRDDHDHDHRLVDRASSSDSISAPKRKAEFDEEEYIRANPELYGLRRSVLQPRAVKIFPVWSNANFSSPASTCATTETGKYSERPILSFQMLIPSSMQVESESESDAEPVSRRQTKRRRVDTSHACKSQTEPRPNLPMR